MAIFARLSFLFLVAAAASLHLSSLLIDARATPESHFSATSVSRGHGLYGGESAITADELYRIETQFDKDSDDEEELKSDASSDADTKSATSASKTEKVYGADSYASSGIGNAYATNEYGSNGERTSSYGFGNDRFSDAYATNQYGSRQQESSLYGYNNNNGQTSTSTKAQSYRVGTDLYPNEFGSRQQESSQSMTMKPYRFGSSDFNYNTNEFGSKQQESTTRSTAIPNSYGTYSSSNNYYSDRADTNANKQMYYGMSDTRRPENQKLYFDAAKGLVTTSKVYNVNNNEQTANYGYNNNKQSQNEFATMEEYYQSQGIKP